MIHHFEDNYKFFYFRQGYIAVEFYLLVSGFLMAKRVSRQNSLPTTYKDIAGDTWKFICGKVRGFYKYYFCVMILWLVILQVYFRHKDLIDTVKFLLRGLPQITLSFMGLCHDYTGLYVGNTWYLSAMIIAILLLYPLLLKEYTFSTAIVFPFISVFSLGYLYKTHGSICMTFEWNGIFLGGVLRAVAEIALGASLCRLTEYLTQKHAWLLESPKIPPVCSLPS